MNVIHRFGEAPLGVNQQIARLVEITRQPSGFSRLSTADRRLVLAAMLAAMVPADGKIKDIELEALKHRLKKQLQLPPAVLQQALAYVDCGISHNDLRQVANQLQDLLGIENRMEMIEALWEIALCDGQLHPMEEAMVYAIADAAQVPRKRVIETQARVMRSLGANS